jgi:preprotein translocase subunit SecE
VTYHLRDTEEGEVAESKRRRDRDAANEDLDELDEVFDDAADDAADDDALTDEDDDVEEDVEDSAVVGRRRAGTAIKAKEKPERKTPEKATKVRSDEERVGIFGRLFRFFREVVAELRKVIWPTRKELLTYAVVVIVFVTVMLTVVASLDYGFAKAVLFVFGGGKK